MAGKTEQACASLGLGLVLKQRLHVFVLAKIYLGSFYSEQEPYLGSQMNKTLPT